MILGRFSCPCCGYPTLEEKPPGTFAICPVCYWEDDESQFRDPSYEEGANAVSLLQARENFENLGASEVTAREHVRPPSSEEIAHRTRPWLRTSTPS